MDLGSLSRKLNLNHLSEEECETVLKVIQRDFSLRQSEKERLGKIEEEIVHEDNKVDVLAEQHDFNDNCCMRCFSKFFFIFNAKVQCVHCKFNVCKNCSVFVKEDKGYACSFCRKQRDLSTKSCEWFYSDVGQKFKRFGSAKVVRSLHKRKTESEESDYAMSDSAIFTSPTARTRRGRHSNQLTGVFSMDLDENSVNNLERAAKQRDANHNAALDRQPYTCAVAKERESYETVRDAELQQFDAQFMNVIDDVKRTLQDVRARHPTRTQALVTRHEYEKGVDNHKLHLTSALSSLSQSLHIALDNQVFSDGVRNPNLPKTSTAKQLLVKNTIHKEVEKICRCALDLDDERTSEYGSDNSSETASGAYEDLLAHAVIRQLISEELGMSRLDKEEEELNVLISSTSDMSDSSELRQSPHSHDHAGSGDELDELVKRNLEAQHSRTTSNEYKQHKSHNSTVASSREQSRNSTVNSRAESGIRMEIEPVIESQTSAVQNSTKKDLRIKTGHKETRESSKRDKPIPSPRLRHSTPLKPETTAKTSEIQHTVSPDTTLDRSSSSAAPKVKKADTRTGDVGDVTEEDELAAFTFAQQHRPALPSFEIEPESEQSEITVDLTDNTDEDGTILMSDGNITFGSSWTSSQHSLFQDRSIISAYDNFGQKKVGKDKQPTMMMVPQGEVEELIIPRVGDQNADELSDLSENEARSDISLDETPSEDEADLDLEDDLEDVLEESEEGEDGGYFNREGHFVVKERIQAAHVGSGLKRPHTHYEPETVPASTTSATNSTSVQTKQHRTKQLSVQTDLTPVISSPAQTETDTDTESISVNSKHYSKRSRESIDVPPPSPEIADVDPAFVVKPEKIVTVMEGECAKFHVELTGTQPIDVFWYKDTADIQDLTDDDRCDITQCDSNQFECHMYNVTPADQGQYLCIAINEHGQCSRAFKLKVTQFEGEKTAVEFIKKLQDVEVRAGDSAKLRCKVKGTPLPRLVWYQDGTRITHGEHFTIDKFGKRDYVLSIDYVTMDDDAQFSVVASNVAGQASCAAQLIVNPQTTNDNQSHPRHSSKYNPAGTGNTSADFYPDTDALLRLAEQVQHKNMETQRATEDMLQSASRLSAMQHKIDHMDAALDRSEQQLVSMDTNNNKGSHWQETELRTDAANVRKVTENALHILSALETPTTQPKKTSETEIELNFTYEQYDLLYRAGLITHEQIRKGTVKPKDYDKIQQFLEDEKQMEDEIVRKISEEEGGNDVRVTAEYPNVLDCGLKRVDSKRYAKDYIVNRGTPQLKRRVWRVRTNSEEGTEVVQGTPAGEREVVSSDELKEETSESLLNENEVYIAAGKTFHLEQQLKSVEDKVQCIDENTSAEDVCRLQEDIVQVSAHVQQSEQQVRDIERKLDEIQSSPAETFSKHTSQSNTSPSTCHTLREHSHFNVAENGAKSYHSRSIVTKSDRSHSTATQSDHSHPTIMKGDSKKSEAKGVTSPSRDSHLILTSQSRDGQTPMSSQSRDSQTPMLSQSLDSQTPIRSQSPNQQRITPSPVNQSENSILDNSKSEIESNTDDEICLPSVQNLRSMFSHEHLPLNEAGVKRVYSLTGRDIPRSVREKLKLHQRELHPHVATVFQSSTHTNNELHLSEHSNIQPDIQQGTNLEPKQEETQLIGNKQPQHEAFKPRHSPKDVATGAIPKTYSLSESSKMLSPRSPDNRHSSSSSVSSSGDIRRHVSRSDSERSDTSSASLSSAKREKSTAILARAAFWDQRILSGESDDSRVDILHYPQIPQDSFNRNQENEVKPNSGTEQPL